MDNEHIGKHSQLQPAKEPVKERTATVPAGSFPRPRELSGVLLTGSKPGARATSAVLPLTVGL